MKTANRNEDSAEEPSYVDLMLGIYVKAFDKDDFGTMITVLEAACHHDRLDEAITTYHKNDEPSSDEFDLARAQEIVQSVLKRHMEG